MGINYSYDGLAQYLSEISSYMYKNTYNLAEHSDEGQKNKTRSSTDNFGFEFIEMPRPEWYNFVRCAKDIETYRKKKAGAYVFIFQSNEIVEQRIEGDFSYEIKICYQFTIYENGIFTAELCFNSVKNGFVINNSIRSICEDDPLIKLITNDKDKLIGYRMQTNQILPFFYEWLYRSESPALNIMLEVLLAKKGIRYGDFIASFHIAK